MRVKFWSGDGGADVNRVTTETIELGDDQDVSIVWASAIQTRSEFPHISFRSQTESGPQWRKLQATEFRERGASLFLDNQQLIHAAVGATP
jgi:hypothetical protein